MTTKIYDVSFVALTGEKRTILAPNLEGAIKKATKVLAELNADLKESKDNRYPDEIASIEYRGDVDA